MNSISLTMTSFGSKVRYCEPLVDRPKNSGLDGAGHQMTLLSGQEIRRLRDIEKLVPHGWAEELLKRCVAPSTQHRVKILDIATGPTRGELHVYARRGLRDDDYSTGLVLYELDGSHRILLRLNGPHPNRHVNRLTPTVRLAVTPHVHYLTERYQREGGKVAPDGYALQTCGYRSLAEAVSSLARRTRILTANPQLWGGTRRVLP